MPTSNMSADDLLVVPPGRITRGGAWLVVTSFVVALPLIARAAGRATAMFSTSDVVRWVSVYATVSLVGAVAWLTARPLDTRPIIPRSPSQNRRLNIQICIFGGCLLVVWSAAVPFGSTEQPPHHGPNGGFSLSVRS